MISEMTAPASCGAALPSHVGARPSRSRGGLERRVWCLLKRAVPAERQRLLRHLSEPQRRALERWILAHPEVRRRKRPKTGPRSGFVHPRSLSRVQGIESHARQGQLRYRAVVRFGPIRIMTGYCKDLLLAKERFKALQSICHEAPATSGDGASAKVFQCLRHALAQADVAHLELRFFALLPCRHLKTPCLKLEGPGLEANFLAWQRLHELLKEPKTSLEDAWLKAQGISNQAWASVHPSKRVVKRRQAPKGLAPSARGGPRSDRTQALESRLQDLLRRWRP